MSLVKFTVTTFVAATEDQYHYFIPRFIFKTLQGRHTNSKVNEYHT